MSEIIKTEHLTFSYPPDEGKEPVLALGGVSLSIEQGSFVTILGHNGSGKSTLAKHMNAVLLPEGGTVWVDGMDTRDESLLLEIRRRVGMVFQNPDNQIVANVVEEDVAFGPENLGPGGQRPPGGADGGIPDARAPPPLRRAEAAYRHCGCDRHGAEVHRAGRIHRHAGPPGPQGGAGYGEPPQPGEGYHHRPHHPPHGRGRS